MAKIKYQAKENTKVGTHSFYASPIFAGTLTTDEILEEALDGKSIEASVAKAAITEYMKAVQRNVMKGFRCQLGDNFLTIYPNLQLSVKDTEKDGTTIVATADMLNASNGKSRLGCTVSNKFSQEFASSVQWQKVGETAGDGEQEADEDITDNTNTGTQTGDNTGGDGGNGGGGNEVVDN